MGRAVVIRDCILAVRHPDPTHVMLTVLRASVQRGASCPDMSTTTLCGLDAAQWREATRQDFDDFRIKHHPDYTD